MSNSFTHMPPFGAIVASKCTELPHEAKFGRVSREKRLDDQLSHTSDTWCKPVLSEVAILFQITAIVAGNLSVWGQRQTLMTSAAPPP